MIQSLPAETILHIAQFLPAQALTRLSLTSKHLRQIVLDTELWRQLCFHESYSRHTAIRENNAKATPILNFRVQQTPTSSSSHGPGLSALGQQRPDQSIENQRSESAINYWHQTISGEDIDWHLDYVGRHAQLHVDWLSLPGQEAHGLGILGGGKAIAPLDDGSLRIWDIDARGGSYGAVIDQSYPGLLCHGGNKGKSTPSSGFFSKSASHRLPPPAMVVEGVTVDIARNKAYIALGRDLNEIDLTTLQVESRSEYPEDISVISTADDASPLTVGTAKALYIHDPRVRPHIQTPAADIKEHMKSESTLYRIIGGDPDYAPLSQPLPLSIIHRNTHSIHVAGRFPSLLNYDRRSFPRVQSTVYSGARLSCLTTVPSPADTTTLAAAGDYNGKGSIEVYRINAESATLQDGQLRNRTSASRSKCLSLVSHGSRLLFSDSDGMVKWVERDATTIVRRWNINAYTESLDKVAEAPTAPGGIFSAEAGTGDVARRMVPVNERPDSDIAIWTGEKIGIMSFGSTRKLSGDAREEDTTSESISDEERDYGRMMRKALEKQADEVRFVRNMGLGRSL